MYKTLTISIGVLLLTGIPALADWNEGDGYKMYFPQMSNPRSITLVPDQIGQVPNEKSISIFALGECAFVNIWEAHHGGMAIQASEFSRRK